MIVGRDDWPTTAQPADRDRPGWNGNVSETIYDLLVLLGRTRGDRATSSSLQVLDAPASGALGAT